MATLAPTVHERLARCGTRIFVDGLVSGADVRLSIDGAETAFTATGSARHVAVPALVPGAAVKARQDAGSGFSPWSPVVVVEDALLPPGAAPQLPENVGACSHCLRVAGMVPGCEVEALVGPTVVGTGTADRHGAACLGIDLSKARDRAKSLSARMIVCGQPGPLASTPIVLSPALTKPVVGSPLYGCQGVVPLASLVRGSRVRLETDGGDSLGSFCSCWTAVNVWVLRTLVTGEQVRAQPYFDGPGACKQTGPWSAWQPVIAPDQNIKPKVLESLVAGDQTIRVEKQIPGATLVIRIRPTAAHPPDEFGPRPASEFQDIALNAPLAAGNVVSVVQTLCELSVESDPVTVLPPPPEVLAPVILPPLYECAAAVQVSNLHPGALVRLYLNGIPIGVAWAGSSPSLAVPAAPSLIAGAKVTATQTVGGVTGPASVPVLVLAVESVQRPRILRPVAIGDTAVWVSRVTPGAQVRIRANGMLIGETAAAEPVVRVPVTPVSGPVTATANLCSLSKTSTAVTPITDPGATGIFASSGEELVQFTKWSVPATGDGDAFDTRIEGQVYFPATAKGRRDPSAKNLPLVVIAHGYWPEFYVDEATGDAAEVKSFIGYDYLAHRLARWGMLVFSLRMDDVNTNTSTQKPHQYARAEILLHAIDEILAHPTYGGLIDETRIGLVGHSMGGEGAVVAQAVNHE
ncbi:MAG: hypothetical protein FJ027_14035 [Candidatus Rokubacteria bacterium]|nr:hypothetical protein [Candidatus Rokubacteria bacterium]